MAFLTLAHYTPPPRYDSEPWTQARIEQAADEDGTYATLETIDLAPVDDDPRDPHARSFTLEDATVGDWYRIVWLDAQGDQSLPTLPVHFIEPTSSTVYGTRTELARRLKVAETGNEDALDRVLLIASFEIQNTIGRSDLNSAEAALATEVSLERAGEHWQQLTSPFGFVGLGIDATPFIAARDSWERHAYKLAPLIDQWGIA